MRSFVEDIDGIEEVNSILRHLQHSLPEVRWDVTDVVAEGESKLVIKWTSRHAIYGESSETQDMSFTRRKDGKIRLIADFRYRGS